MIPAVLDYLIEQGKEPDVLLFQESTISQDKAISKWGLSCNYQQQKEGIESHIRQGIDTILGVSDMKSLSEQMHLLMPEGETNKEDALAEADIQAGFKGIIVSDSRDRRLIRSDIASRAFARKLEVPHNGTKIEVIVVSFHSVYKVTDDEKRRYIKLFFNLMCRLAILHECLVLIGGDFNLPVGDWKQDIEEEFQG